ncbi:hypothetical protein Thiosp_01200 [Thiorhodovibrio litoralis]|nr:hypothetical protein Thiosp_01200 [Thiorhodovibrio litoralis]
MLPVAGVHQGRIGFISLQSDAWYQAELGLASADGGWLMLARSNRLALLPPIRCDFGKEPALADLSAPEQQSARAHCNPAVGTVLSAAGDLFRSQGGVAPAPVNRRGGDAQSAVRAIIEASAAYRNAVDCNAGAGSSAWHDNTFTDRCARSGSDPGSYTGSDPGSDQAVDQALDSALARPIIPSARGAFGARPVAGDDDKARYPTAGSGPIESVRDASDADIWGQLRIGGRAAPGSLLELGGHSYRVGPGGALCVRSRHCRSFVNPCPVAVAARAACDAAGGRVSAVLLVRLDSSHTSADRADR